MVLREPRSSLLVRQIRRAPEQGCVYENRARYHRVGAWYIIHESRTVAWRDEGAPTIVQEDHWFRSTQDFQQAAPAFFPLHGDAPQGPGLFPVVESEDDTEVLPPRPERR